jgi:hypothetical protein
VISCRFCDAVVADYRHAVPQLREDIGQLTGGGEQGVSQAIQASEDIWHRSIEDLLRSIEPAQTPVAGPFVINLRTTTAPIALPSKDLPPFDRLHLYRLANRVGGRPQFQLRLGIIDSELEADAILATVRQLYPTATKQPVDAADRAAIARAVPSASPAPAPAPAASATVAVAVAVSSNTVAPDVVVPNSVAPPAPTPTVEPVALETLEDVSWDIDEMLPDLAKIERRREPIAPHRSATPGRVERNALPAAPRVGEAIRVTPEAAAPTPVTATLQTSSESDALQSIVTRIGTLIEAVEEHRPSAPAAAAAPAAAPPVVRPSSPLIDSTHTVRALTALELADDETSRWFSIQLMLGEEPIDAEQVPNLDIFEEYRLYTVTGLEQERLMHALRLGFFSSEVAAQAVSGYLATYFAAPTIKRVSIGERERFAERRVSARKDVGASGRHAIIDFVAEPALPKRSVEVAATASAKRAAPEAPSLWARLTAFGSRR